MYEIDYKPFYLHLPYKFWKLEKYVIHFYQLIDIFENVGLLHSGSEP
jgi:hypothetical protein